MTPGYAADDGAAMHFVGDDLARVVASRAGARAYHGGGRGYGGRRDADGDPLPRAARTGARPCLSGGCERRPSSRWAAAASRWSPATRRSTTTCCGWPGSARPRPRICLLPTAGGDSDDQIRRFYATFGDRHCELDHISLFRLGANPVPLRDRLLGQDAVYVGGGSLVNLIAVWRAQGLDAVLRDAWQAGVVLAGISAGAMCWFEFGITTGTGRPEPRPGLPASAGSFSVTTTASRPTARCCWRRRRLDAGRLRAPSGAGLLFFRVRGSRGRRPPGLAQRGRSAWRGKHRGVVVEDPLPTRSGHPAADVRDCALRCRAGAACAGARRDGGRGASADLRRD
jgi:peptidase E